MFRQWVWLAVPLAAAALGTAGAPPPPAPDKPSVLLVTLDTTRADKLGCYGKTQGLTPNLDAWASRSLLFSRCETPVPETVPAHLTMLSGWYPDRHGLRKNLEVRVAPDVPLLSEEFKQAGYATGAFVSAFVLSGDFGLARGFDEYDDSFYDPRTPQFVERRAEETLALARKWLAARQGPWFCWVHLYDPHLPYDPPAPYAAKHKGKPYDGEVAYMDASLGAFLADLEKGGKLKDAVLVICGDHGESLGEHGEMAHGIFLYEATTWVPLILKAPALKGAGTVDTCVSLADVAPTLREICGLKAVAGDGVSLAPALSGRPVKRPPPYIESMTGLYSYGWAPLYALVDWPAKFVLAPRRELYRLDRDRGEKSNLYSASDKSAAKMEKALKERIGQEKKVRPESLSLDKEELRSLQSLGYIAGTTAAAQAGGSFRDPKDVIHLMDGHREALDMLHEERFAEAAKGFEALLKQDPKNPLFHYYLGNSLEQDRPDAALAEYKKAIQYRPTFPQAYIRLIFLLEAQGRSKEAYDVAALALTQVEDLEGEIRSLQAWAAYETGKPTAEVLALLDRAKGPTRETSWALKLRALIALKGGDREAALRHLEAMAKACTPQDVAQLGTDARFRELKTDERFWALVLKARKQVQESGKTRAF
jgi:arylsulfatase A-like enzyme